MRTRRAALGLLLTAGLIAPAYAPAAAADLPTSIGVGDNPIAVEISPDGTRAYVTNAADRTVSVISTATRTVTATVTVGTQPEGIAFSPDSRTAYVANAGDHNTDWGSVSVIDTTTSTVARTVSVHPLKSPRAVVVAPDGGKAYAVGSDHLAVIDTATGVAHPVHVGGNATDVQITPDGSRLYVADFYNKRVVVVSTATESVIATVPLPTAPNNIAITPNGTRAYVTSYSSDKVYLITTADNQVSATVDVPGGPLGVAAAPNGGQIYLTGHQAHTLMTLSVNTNTIIQTRSGGWYPRSVAITPNGFEAYALQAHYVSVADISGVNEPGPDRLVRGESLTAYQSRTSPDGKYRLLMQADGNLVLYVAATNQALWATHTHGSGATRVTLQHDGNLVLYAPNNVPKWATHTWGTAADRLLVQNDSGLALHGPGGTRFWSR
ncbi:hypothetical protein [Lentzea sp. NEAU-D7]|uniref:hypothetical protein n=1 Tax=Lentzea sp. NEAU-D7 TaxID=2994667 RepID=UPI00224B4553|nr:hypothetical protein [Lentzea sp. NEAU-D7]MCX2947924.1 hypothetical protein [Lentzea sp. NEAU-D7]